MKFQLERFTWVGFSVWFDPSVFLTYRLATSHLSDMQLSMNDVSVGAIHVGRFTCVVHTNLGGGIAHINKSRSQAHRSPRRGETGGISTGIYRKGYPTSFSSGAFLLKFLGLRFTQPGVDRRAAVFGECVAKHT